MKLPSLLCLLAALASAPAAILEVTTTADTGAGSLRAQIAAAASGDSVSISTTGTISLTTGEITIAGKNLTVTGPGANVLTITTNGTKRALKIVNAQCAISGISFQNCKALPGDVDTGGAIAVDNFTSGGSTHVTTITDCAFTNNQSGWGGALDVFNGGLVLSRCTFSGNSCTGVAFGTNGGGGALSVGPTVASTISNCTFSANVQTSTAAGQLGGGAVYNYGAGFANPPPVTFEHCTFAGNVDASTAAGAIRGNYTGSYRTAAALTNCLLLNNQAAGTLKNFAGNLTGPLTASYASLGGNVTDEGTTSAQFMPSGIDQISVAGLSATVVPTLALNGGTTKTHAITRGSPAQQSGGASTVATDQRGAPRNGTADAGAFELIEPELSITISSTPIGEGGTLAFGPTPFDTPALRTITITNTQTSIFTTGPLSLAGLSLPSGYTSTGLPTTTLANGKSASIEITLQSGIAGLSNAPLTFTGNDRFNPALALATAGSPNQHVIHLSGLVTDTAEHWRRTHFGPGATNSGASADDANPAGDGIANLLKYGLGLDPFVAYAPGAATTTELDAAGFLRMRVAKNPAAADVAFAIEVTGDLKSPTAWNGAETTVEENTFTTLQTRDNVPLSDSRMRFIRLNVTRP